MHRRSYIAAVIVVIALLVVSPLSVYSFTNGEAAYLVLGQNSFVTGAPAAGKAGMNEPGGLAFDSSGNLWVVDSLNNRVLEFTKPFKNDEGASLVIGQSSFTKTGASTSSTGLSGPSDIAFDSAGNLWVEDEGNNRILEFVKGSGFSSGESASIVLGQSSFTTSVGQTSQTGLNDPADMAIDQSGNVWVADFLNNRILEFVKGSGFTDGQPASLVLGQSSFTAGAPQTTQNGLWYPDGLAFDSSGNLWATDLGNCRLLEFVKGSSVTHVGEFVDDQDASLVLGQSSFTSGCPDSLVFSSTTLPLPCCVVVDSSNNVWVDSGNRVLMFPSPVTSDEAATRVIGQTSFTTNSYADTQTGLDEPTGLALDSSGNLWVSDTYNSRVLEYLWETQQCAANNVYCATSHFTGPNLVPNIGCPPICTVPQGSYELTVSVTDASIGSARVTFSQNGVAFNSLESCTNMVCGPYSVNLVEGNLNLLFQPSVIGATAGTLPSLTFKVKVTKAT